MPGVNFLYYCSLLDVQEEILNATPNWAASGRKADDPFIRRAIRKSYTEINAKAKVGGYSVPITNSTKTTVDGALTVSNNVKTITIDDNASLFSVGDTVRIHGKLSSVYKDEFTGIVKIASSVMTVEFLENAYDDEATFELCTEGYLWLNSCNAIGAAYKVLAGLTVGQARSKNDRLAELRENWEDCKTELQKGTVDLDGLSVGKRFIKTFQTDNPDEAEVVNGPLVTLTERF